MFEKCDSRKYTFKGILSSCADDEKLGTSGINEDVLVVETRWTSRTLDCDTQIVFSVFSRLVISIIYNYIANNTASIIIYDLSETYETKFSWFI